MAAPGFCLYVVGRLRGIPRERLTVAVQAAGGQLVRTPGYRVDLVALSHSSALVSLVEAPPPALPAGIPPDAVRISELTLKRHLGLLRESGGYRHLLAEDLERASGLRPEMIDCLALFDVLELVEGQFGFRDLRAARKARRLLKLGFGLDEIVEASVVLRQHGRGLHDAEMTEAPWGELMQTVGGRTGQLNGQYVLPFGEECASVDELIAQAEICEEAGDLTGADRLYRIAHRIERLDPVIPFNLGTIVDRLGRPREAMLLYQQAIGRDPDFPEAWVNMAGLQEVAGDNTRAEASLRRPWPVPRTICSRSSTSGAFSRAQTGLRRLCRYGSGTLPRAPQARTGERRAGSGYSAALRCRDCRLSPNGPGPPRLGSRPQRLTRSHR